MDIQKAVIELAYAIKRAVRPHIGLQSSKLSAGKTSSGDEEFAIDEFAEHSIEEFIRKHDLQVAYYTEGRGLVKCANPQHLLVLDPIDGTRPSMVGLEGGVVSIAAAPYSLEATLGDVTFGCVLELKQERLYSAESGGFVHIRDGEVDMPVDLTLQTDLDRMSWTFELAGRASKPIMDVLAPLVDRSSIRGGVFLINGSAFSLMRVVSGQLDAMVDIGNRIYRDCPQFRPQFIEAGLGGAIGLFPYDIAAAAMIARTAGCIVTDAYGNSLDGVMLLDTSEENISTCVTASNPVLHERLLEEIDSGIRKLSDSV